MILFITRFPPDRDGFGGAQRAWHILQTLLAIGPVDLAVVYRTGDTDIEAAELDAGKLGVRWARKLSLRGWEEPLRVWPWLPYKLGSVLELVRPWCTEAPRFPRSTLREVADALPEKRYDLVVAGRLPSATLVDSMLDAGLLSAGAKVLDLDDVMSDLKRRSTAIDSAKIGRLRTWQANVDADRMERAETRSIAEWPAVSVCSDEDVAKLRRRTSAGDVVRVPNAVDRDLLPPPPEGRKILFVGSLHSAANLQGLNRFVEEAWPIIRKRAPTATFDVVGMHASDLMRRKLAENGIALHADVPSVRPYYETANVAISPIFFGSGTRIKVIETLAYGRALVSSTLGAEGLGVEDGVHALIADDMPAFADAIIRVLDDRDLARSLAANGRSLYEGAFGPRALREPLTRMIEDAMRPKAAAA